MRGIKQLKNTSFCSFLISARLTNKVGLLSGGQRQAVTLLMTAMNSPKLLLLDEHTAALDPKTAAKVLEITEKIVREQKLTIEDLLGMFTKASGGKFTSDRAILA